MEHPETFYSASAGVRMLIASRGESYECAQQRGTLADSRDNTSDRMSPVQ